NASPNEGKMLVKETEAHIHINTGKIQCCLNKAGEGIFQTIERDGKTLLENGKLVVIRQEGAGEYIGSTQAALFLGEIQTVMVEQEGLTRSVIKIEGTHVGENGTDLLPFILRLYFYADSDSIRMMHTILFDGDENKDFIKGLGFRFSVPLSNELHDRHIRFAGENDGVFGEAVRGLTGLRRNPGEAIKKAQLDGKITPPLNEFPENIAGGLQYIPAFGDYSLRQLHPDSFDIKKRTGSAHAWLKSGF